MGELTTPLCNQDSKTFDDEPYSDTVYLNADTIYLDNVGNGNTNQWNVTVLVEKNPVLFKVDTGAEVTALSEDTFRTFSNPAPQLQKSPHTLSGANRSTFLSLYTKKRADSIKREG